MSVGFWGACQLNPFQGGGGGGSKPGGCIDPLSPKLKARPPSRQVGEGGCCGSLSSDIVL